MTRTRFERLVARALRDLPVQFRERLENIEVIVEDEPAPQVIQSMGLSPAHDTLFGLYQGVPLTERTSAYGMVLPDRLTIFQGPIERACASDWQIGRQVKHTVIHEIAHYFGISDAQLRVWGVY